MRLSSEKDRIPVTLFKKAAVFHTGSLFSYADHTHETVLKYIKQAKKQNVFISYDPNWRGTRIKDKRTARSRIKALLPRVDLLKLSETDALGLTGRRSLPYALDAIRDISKCEIVVTRGKKGAFYWDGKEQTAHPAFKVNVVDTIGAGDAFTAGLIYRYLAKGKEGFRREKRENLAFASAVSALICAGRGATEGLKNLSQVERFLSREKEQRPLLFP
ncbi:MAG: hypothetical protein KAS86_01215 [Candidatus Omnitrophica bacterium]|nr:hypothetical protein [Candidatus Omnitrophota bacterium]